jgi:hypothetical protein
MENLNYSDSGFNNLFYKRIINGEILRAVGQHFQITADRQGDVSYYASAVDATYI